MSNLPLDIWKLKVSFFPSACFPYAQLAPTLTFLPKISNQYYAPLRGAPTFQSSPELCFKHLLSVHAFLAQSSWMYVQCMYVSYQLC